MLFVLAGIAVGLLVAIGPLGWLHGATDSLSTSLIFTGSDIVQRLLEAVPGTDNYPNVVIVVATVIGLALPGSLAMALAWCARTSGRSSRSSVSVVFVVLAIAGFFVLGFSQAFLLAVFLLAGAVLVVSPLYRVTATAAVALAVMMAADVARSIARSANPYVDRAADTMANVTGQAGGGLWTLLAIAAVAAPFLGAVAVILRGMDSYGGRGLYDHRGRPVDNSRW